MTGDRTLLLLSGGIEAVPGIRRAREMGLHVVVSDVNPAAPGIAVADDALIASTYDVEGTVAAARRYHREVRHIDGVMCIASDVPVTVASVAEALGLPGIRLASALLAADKLAMKRAFAGAGVPTPWFEPVDSAAQLRALADSRGVLLVIKPVDSRGARGVLRLTPEVDLGWAFDVAQRYSPTGRVMVEEFIAGPQVSTESLVLDGVAHTPGFSDRNYELLERFAPHVIENGGELPSALPDAVQIATRELVTRAARALGIVTGPVKGDIVVRGDEPLVIELAARLSGGYFCTHEIPLNTGVDFVGQAIRLALGDEVEPRDLAPRFQRGVAQRYLFPAPGRVVQVAGADEVARREGIAMCEVRVRPGDVVAPVDCHPARAGVVITTADTRAAAVERAVAAASAITIETVPLESGR